MEFACWKFSPKFPLKMIEIKTPSISDASEIAKLMESLGYPGTELFMEKRIDELLSHKDEALFVAVKKGQVLGVISLHFIPQLALAGDFCRISYFCVSSQSRSKGIGALLEKKAVEVAKERGCNRIEVHCNERRTRAHLFYHKQGYIESPKYLCKLLPSK